MSIKNFEEEYILPESDPNLSPRTTFKQEDGKEPEATFILEGLRRNTNLIVFDGFAYHTNYSTDKMRYLQCASRLPLGCPARANMAINDDTNTIQLTKPHAHGPDPHLVQRTTFINELKKRVVHQAGTIKAVYDQACLDFPNVSALVPFPSIEHSMRRARATTVPPQPASLFEFGCLISKPEWKRLSQTVNGRPFFMTTLDVEDGSTAIVFSNPEFLLKVVSATQIHVDCSYIMDTPIAGGKYLFSVHVIMHRHSNVILYALLTRRSRELYEAILTRLQECMPMLSPTNIITDFEKDLYLAVKTTFPNASIQTGYYHYLTHVYQKLSSLGLTNSAELDLNIVHLVKQIMALPLLPADKIASGLNIIEESALKCLSLAAAKRLMDYLDNTWWYGVTAAVLTKFNFPDTTNNNIHMFHKTIRQRFLQVSNAWVFVEKLKEVECIVFRDFLLLEGGHGLGRERKTKLLSSDEKCSRAWRMLASRQRMPTAVFFDRAVEFLHTLESQLRVMIDDYEEVEFIQGIDVLGDKLQVLDRRCYDGSGAVGKVAIRRKEELYSIIGTSKRRKVAEPLSEVEEAEKPTKVCMACKDEDWEARCELKPCGHKPFCTVCAARIVEDLRKCPKCKKKTTQFVEMDDL